MKPAVKRRHWVLHSVVKEGKEKNMSEQIERKKRLLELMREAEQLAYEYFSNCELGSEREAAAQVYENIRTATRVHG